MTENLFIQAGFDFKVIKIHMLFQSPEMNVTVPKKMCKRCVHAVTHSLDIYVYFIYKYIHLDFFLCFS